jgi:hypothetical protein
MWLFTTIGFFSVVQKSQDSFLTVRARVASDLDRLREKYMPELSETIKGRGSDYPYRGTISHEDFAKGMEKIVKAIHYDNFKAEVEAKMGIKRETIYHEVWSSLLKLQKERE